MYCLGIETSCDETAVSLLKRNTHGDITILAEEISSQIDMHKAYGGVVPELAAREHLKNLPLITDIVLNNSGVNLEQIDLIAVTQGPGLKGCLLIGTNFARGLAIKYNTPLIGVNHIEAHIFSVMLDNPEIEFPFLALVVSGGHTEIVLVEDLGKYQIMARTLDDAAGEAFDKTANLLSIPYPGGAKLASLADQVTKSRFALPKVMRDSSGFSFSGLKTAIMLLVKKNQEQVNNDRQALCEIAFAVQESIIEALLHKLRHVIKEKGINRVAVSGGVSANKSLRKKLSSEPGVNAFYPSMLHCTDNASMIALLGLKRFIKFKQTSNELEIHARWPVESL